MLKHHEGIIFRTVKYGESSLILDIFTSEDGMASYIIGGVRSKKAKTKASMLQVTNLVSFVAYHKSNDQLRRIKEISYAYVYQSLPFQVIKSSIAIFLIEVSRNAVKMTDEHREAYRFMKEQLVTIDKSTDTLTHFPIAFLIEYAAISGVEINNNCSPQRPFFNIKRGVFTATQTEHRYSLDKDASRFLSHYLSREIPTGITKTGRKNIMDKLLDFYVYHIEGFGKIRSLDVLETVFE